MVAYIIDERILKRVDMLEGYPEHYDRDEIIPIIGDEKHKAFTYFVNQKIDFLELELLEEFEKDEFYYGMEIDNES